LLHGTRVEKSQARVGEVLTAAPSTYKRMRSMPRLSVPVAVAMTVPRFHPGLVRAPATVGVLGAWPSVSVTVEL
jgi:hypothetical protein